MSSAHRRLLLFAATFALSLLSCGREVTGPENGFRYGRARFGAVSLAPQMPSLLASLAGAGDVVPFERVRVVLRRENGSVTVDTLVDFPDGADSIALSLLVPLPIDAPEEGLPLALTMAYVNAAGDTVFRGGPIAVVAPPVGSGTAPQPITIPVIYDGVGKDAARVSITPDSGTRVAGSSSTFTAGAFDATNAAIANTPLIFYTLDSSRAVVPSAGSGQVNWLPNRGVARIVAALPNGARADTAFITVALPASKLVVQSGNAQSGIVSRPLAQPLVLRTLASDDVPVAGVIVNFAVVSGNGALNITTDTSDANGVVSTNWTLGAALGAQSVAATASGLAGSPLTLTATATPGAPAQVAFTQVPTTVVAGATLTPPVLVAVRDSAGNLVTGFTGSVALTLPDSSSGLLDGIVQVNAVGGIATFSTLSFGTVGTYSLIAILDSTARDTSTAITVTPGAGARLEFVTELAAGVAGLPFTPAVTVRARDAQGNLATGFTGTIALALLNANGASLAGPISAPAVNGVATFSGVSIAKAGLGYALAASSGALVPDTSATFAIAPAAPATIVVVAGDAQTGPAGSALAERIVVEVRDAFTNPTSGVSLAFAVLNGGSSTTSSAVTDSLGRASTSWILGPTVGAQVLRASVPLTPPLTRDISATATVGVPVGIVFTQSPSTTQVAGRPFTPAVTVEVVDAVGNRVPNYAGSITLALGPNAPDAALRGPLTVTAVSGVATFPGVFVEVAGAEYSLQAFADSLTPSLSAAFSVASDTAAVVTPFGGDEQTGAVNIPLADSVAVRVTDAFGNGVAGVSVTFTAAEGDGSATPSVATTNAEGKASTRWTLGTTAGAHILTANIANGAQYTFSAIGTAVAPTTISVDSGDQQLAAAGSEFTEPLRVLVTDAFGNPVANTSVAWSAVGASVASDISFTDAAGIAAASVTADSGVGVASVVATLVADSSKTATFTLEIEAGAATTPVIETAPVDGSAGLLLESFSFAVTDAFGNLATSFAAPVTLSARFLNGSPAQVLLQGTSVVASGGRAVFGNVRIDVAGTYRLVADFGALGTVETDPIVIDVGPATTIVLVEGEAQSATVGDSLAQPLRVRVTDAFGNGVAGINVNWGVITGDAAVTDTVVTTDSTGVAQTGVLLGTVSGALEIGAFAAGLDGSPVIFTATVIPAGPSALVLVDGDGQIATVGDSLAQPLRVRVTDAFGNGVAGINVNWGVITGDAAVTDTVVTTDSTGVAQTGVLLGTEAGVIEIGAFAAELEGSPVSFTATANAGGPTTIALIDGDAQSATVGDSLAQPLRVRVTDAFGNGVAGINVNWGVTLGAASVTDTVVTTDSTGLAQTSVLLGIASGALEIGAFADGLDGSPVIFAATATAGAAFELLIAEGDAQSAPAGAPFTFPFVVRVVDSFGNGVSGVAVTFSGNDGIASLGDTIVISGADGLAITTATAGATAGAASIGASALELAPVNFALSVTASAASELLFQSLTLSGVAGETYPSIDIAIRDSLGNVVTDFADSVTIAIGNGPSGATIGGTVMRLPVAGLVSFDDLVLTVAGGYNLTVASGGLTATTPTIIVTAAAAASIAADGSAERGGSVTTAIASPLAVKVTDTFGNPISGETITWSVVTGDVTVSAATSSTNALGIASVDAVAGPTAGIAVVTASRDTLSGSPVSFTLTITAGVGTQIAVVTPPTNGTAGAPLPAVTVAVRDSLGNVATDFVGTIAVAVNAGPAATIGTVLGTSSVASGLATFEALVLETAGAYQLRFSALGLTDAVTDTFAIAPDTAAVFDLLDGNEQSDTVARALDLPLRVRVTDAFGNGIAGEPVVWTPNAAGTVAQDTTITDASGIASVSFTLGTTSGGTSVTAATPGLPATQVLFTLTAIPDVVAELAVTAQPDTVVSGAIAPPITLEVRDQFGNVVTWFTGNISAIVSDAPAGELAAGTTTRAAVAGVAVFDDLVFSSSGSWFLLFTAGEDASTGTSVTVIAGAPSSVTIAGGDAQLGFVTQPLPLPLQVLVTDANNNPVVGDTIVFTVTDGGGTLSSEFAVDSAVTDASGIAQTTWTLGGDIAVAQQVQASRAGFATLSFTATPVPLVASRIWTGEVDGDATNAANWQGAVIPAATDSVFVPSDRPNYPTLGANTLYAGMTLQSGASLTVLNARLELGGSLRALGTASVTTVGTGEVALSSPFGGDVRGTIGRLVIEGGTYAASDSLTVESLDITSAFLINGQTVNVSGNVLVQGVLDVAGAGARIGGQLTTDGLGHLLMDSAGDSLSVGSAVFAGGTDGTQLTAGVLDVRGNFTQSALDATTYSATASHRLRMSGDTSVIQIDDALNNPIGALHVTDGTQLVITGGNIRVEGVAVLEGTTATASADSSGAVLIGGLIDSVGNRWSLPVTRFEGPNPLLPAAINGSVTFANSAVLAAPLEIADTLRIATLEGDLDLGGQSVRAAELLTDDNGRLTMSSPNDSLLVSGSASFAGGTSVLTDGYLEIGGSFSQSGTSDAFAALAAHETWFTGGDSATIRFANGSFGETGSRFGRLGFNKAVGLPITFESDVFVNGVWETTPLGNPSLQTDGPPRRLVTRGAAVQDVSFNNLRWELLDGADASTPISNVSFGELSSTVPQFRVARPSGTISLVSPSFATVPTTGVYVQAEDTNVSDEDILTVAVTSPLPEFHGGKITLVDAELTGWEAFAVLTWTNGGADRDWFNAANWAEGVIPTATDSVFIDGANSTPIIALPAAVRALHAVVEGSIELSDTLTVTGSLSIASLGNISCTGGVIALAAVDTVVVDGTFNCPVLALSGAMQLAGPMLADTILALGDARVIPRQHTLNVIGDFTTTESAALVMTDSAGLVTVGGTAGFFGTAVPGAMTAGTLVLTGAFVQGGSATAFQADAGHLTRFTADQSQSVFFENPDSSAAGSHFGSLSIENNEGGVSVGLSSDVFVNGVLRGVDGSSRRFAAIPGEGTAITSRGAEITGTVDFDGVRWRLVDGAAVSSPLVNVRFTNQSEGSTQLLIARDSGSMLLSGFEFDTLPSTTTYLQVVDAAPSDGDTLTITMSGTLPQYHSGRLDANANASVIGWEAEPSFIWTGSESSSWETAANWSDFVVPNATSAVEIPNAESQPVISSPVAVRRMTFTGATTGLILLDTLVVTEALHATETATVSCDGAGIIRFLATDTATVRGSLDCGASIVAGVVRQSGNTSIGGTVVVDSIGRLSIGGFAMTLAAPTFTTAGQGTLQMNDAAGSLTINGTANFGGGATTGLLTAGTLTFLADVLQQGGDPAAFDADAGLNVVLSPVEQAFLAFESPESSGLGTTTVASGVVTVSGITRTRGSLTVQGQATLEGFGGRLDVDGNITGTGSLAVTTTSLTGSFLRVGNQQPDTVVFTGTDQQIRASIAGIPIGWNTVVVEGTARAVSNGSPTDTVAIAQSLIVRGAGARLTFDNTSTVGDSLVVRTLAGFGTRDGGTFEMAEEGVSVLVRGFSIFAGGDQTGLLTDGRLILQAGMRDTVPNAFVAGGAHRTVIGGCNFCDGIPVQNSTNAALRFGTLRFVNGSTSNIGAGFIADTLTLLGGAVSMQGTGSTMRVNGDITGVANATLNAARLEIGGALGFDGTYVVDTTVFIGTGQRMRALKPNGEPIPYEAVDVTGTVQTLMASGDSLVVNGQLRILGNGRLRFGETSVPHRIQVNQLVTENSGTIEMRDGNAEVNVLLTAFFEGGSTAGLLTAGFIKFHGPFTQTDINSTASYQASGTHFSEFVLGEVTPSILFANPGFGEAESRFNQLGLQPAGGNTLQLRSDVYASAQLIQNTLVPVTMEASQAPYRRLLTKGASADNVTFRGVSWTISDGIAISSTLVNLIFVDQDPTVTQLAIRRAGGTFGLLVPTFSTIPTTGKYLELEDVLGDASVLTVNVSNPTPGFHSGFAVTSGGALLSGWPATQGGQIRADTSPTTQRDH